MTWSLRWWSSPRGDESGGGGSDFITDGVLRQSALDERPKGMQERSCGADSAWRERESGKGALHAAMWAPF
jgi:hypothetical protein